VSYYRLVFEAYWAHSCLYGHTSTISSHGALLPVQVVLHMKRLLAKPKRIYLAGPSNLQQPAKLEVVEATASIKDVMQLLLQLQMVTRFQPPPAQSVYCLPTCCALPPR
jgi:hypothetical protein